MLKGRHASVQAQIPLLFRQLRNELGLSCLFVTHDSAVIRQIVDRMYVCCRGEIAEERTGRAGRRPPTRVQGSPDSSIPKSAVEPGAGIEAEGVNGVVGETMSVGRSWVASGSRGSAKADGVKRQRKQTHALVPPAGDTLAGGAPGRQRSPRRDDPRPGAQGGDPAQRGELVDPSASPTRASGAAACSSAVREALLDGDPWRAQFLAELGAFGIPRSQAAYQTLGHLTLLSEGHHEEWVEDYERRLNVCDGVASVSYRFGGAAYLREVFASVPDQVLVVHVQGPLGGALNLGLELWRRFDGRSEAVSSSELEFSGRCGSNGTNFVACSGWSPTADRCDRSVTICT